jgi:hypothetical protein
MQLFALSPVAHVALCCPMYSPSSVTCLSVA